MKKAVLFALALGFAATAANAVPYADGLDNEWRGTSWAEYIEMWVLL